jgi:hypothetical protein
VRAARLPHLPSVLELVVAGHPVVELVVVAGHPVVVVVVAAGQPVAGRVGHHWVEVGLHCPQHHLTLLPTCGT